jgi:hypothetical protein
MKMSIRVYNPNLRFDYVFLVFFETMLKSLLISIKLADCNSLQGGGEKAEELRWIIAGWIAGKLIESAEENSTSADTP